MTAGVYRIRNRVTGRIYIGSSFDIHRRIMTHLSALRTGRHANTSLQAEWVEHGKEAFAFSILETTFADDWILCQAEDRWIAVFRLSAASFYNQRAGHIGRHLGASKTCSCQRCSARQYDRGAVHRVKRQRAAQHEESDTP